MSDSATNSTSYDTLFVTKMFFFLALVLMCNIAIVTTVYTFWLEKPFHSVLTKERESFASSFNPNLHQNMRYNGDLLYDNVFVRSGAEGLAYNGLAKPSKDDIAAGALKDLKVFGRILDNIFDYFLLLSHRAGFFFVAFTYVGCLILAVAFHGAIIRHRKRYGFGDTPLLMNVWARAMLAYSVPITVIVWSLPIALTPYLLIGSLTLCVTGVAIFSFSLPKIA